jgi:hypothetical protein
MASNFERAYALSAMIGGFIICATLSAVFSSIIESNDRIGSFVRFDFFF